MAIADELVEKILSWLEQQELCAQKLKVQASELEELRKNVLISTVAGFSVVLLGGVASLAATIFTGGAAAPLLAAVGSVGAGLGSATTIGSAIAEKIITSCTMEEARKIAEKCMDLEKDIKRLVELLMKEREKQKDSACGDVDPAEFVRDRILKAMAERGGLQWDDTLLLRGVADMSRRVMTTPAVPHAAATAFGLPFTIIDLLENIIQLVKNNFVTEASQKLRDVAKKMLELSEVRKDFEKFFKVSHIIGKLEKIPDERMVLIELAMENCEDEATRKWLEENSQSQAFSELVGVFHYLKELIDDEEKKGHSREVDIILVARGSVDDDVIPASCLRPLDTIQDVLLYAPWSGLINANTEYNTARRWMVPYHRSFDKSTNLPDQWSAKGEDRNQKVRNITLSPLGPEGLTSKVLEHLKNNIDDFPERNCIVVPYLDPGNDGSSEGTPLFVVTVALSLVLIFSRFRATVHLAASRDYDFLPGTLDDAELECQYAQAVQKIKMKNLIKKPLLSIAPV
ncbi:uncharacterized protein LOC115363726 [Myripristis murdjan]|uniref:uncharacterized protein LOC115363726 n=1 Tax=Myripristis murdjan TaxID=586833 RepID=UPI001175E2BB|nr:uncharacterized protein LOC115363726 [Myripristis murdjan]